MQNTGESEFVNDSQKASKLELSFWQNFLLTLAGAAGLINMVATGPAWLTYVAVILIVVLFFWILTTRKKK